MVIIVFLVDNSASMCQRAIVNGVPHTFLDVAKNIVELSITKHKHMPGRKAGRYMLLTFEHPPYNVKAGWKESYATFMDELKKLQPCGMTSMNTAVMHTLEFLNQNRIQSGIDRFGQGRYPFIIEPTKIIMLTDVEVKRHCQQNLLSSFTHLTEDHFRWDQRLYALELRMTGDVLYRHKHTTRMPSSEISALCHLTGGKSYSVYSNSMLGPCIQTVLGENEQGVVLNFYHQFSIKGPIDLVPRLTSEKCFVYASEQQSGKYSGVGTWPIPESYRPHATLPLLPPRAAHPNVCVAYNCSDEPLILLNFPIDVYDIDENCSFAHSLVMKSEPRKIWPVTVSTGVAEEKPFGFLKPLRKGWKVQLYILPYNYPMLMPLLELLFNTYCLNPPAEWISTFTSYVATAPHYYYSILKKVLLDSMKVPQYLVSLMLPERTHCYLSELVTNLLVKERRQARMQQDLFCQLLRERLALPKQNMHQYEMVSLEKTLEVNGTIVKNIVVPTNGKTNLLFDINYRNPYDIPRQMLIDAVGKMRFFLNVGVDAFPNNTEHYLKIAKMSLGNDDDIYSEIDLRKKILGVQQNVAIPKRRRMVQKRLSFQQGLIQLRKKRCRDESP